jgi:hypothetical protein
MLLVAETVRGGAQLPILECEAISGPEHHSDWIVYAVEILAPALA